MTTLGQRALREVTDLARELDPAEIDAVTVPAWAEDMLTEVRDPAMKRALRRLYQIGRLRERHLYEQTGYRTIDEYEAAQAEERLFRQIVGAGVPERLAVARFDGSSETPALAAAREYLSAGAQGFLVLAGPTGVGKSWAMACIAEAWSRQALPFRWLHAGELFAQISVAEIRTSSLANATLLLIDDLGAEEGQQVRAKFDALIYHRHGRFLPMVATTNLNAGRLRERYGDRVMDRLAEWGRVVEVGGRSLRRPA